VTVKWVKVDPLVMNGEPFCYATRLTVRNLLEMRSNGLRPREILGENPELRWIGIAEAFRYAAENRARYAEFFDPDGSLLGPGYTEEEAATLPEHLRELRGSVVKPAEGTEATEPIGA
jgi:uncharacterized protein (DUF433 family)